MLNWLFRKKHLTTRKVYRVTLDIPEGAYRLLRRMQRLTGEPLVTVLRDALKLYYGFIMLLKDGDMLYVKRGDAFIPLDELEAMERVPSRMAPVLKLVIDNTKDD